MLNQLKIKDYEDKNDQFRGLSQEARGKFQV